ncbi:hypothetical protein PG984_003567 [Apiospora sp. TS-2023a]
MAATREAKVAALPLPRMYAGRRRQPYPEDNFGHFGLSRVKGAAETREKGPRGAMGVKNDERKGDMVSIMSVTVTDKENVGIPEDKHGIQ